MKTNLQECREWFSAHCCDTDSGCLNVGLRQHQHGTATSLQDRAKYGSLVGSVCGTIQQLRKGNRAAPLVAPLPNLPTTSSNTSNAISSASSSVPSLRSSAPSSSGTASYRFQRPTSAQTSKTQIRPGSASERATLSATCSGLRGGGMAEDVSLNEVPSFGCSSKWRVYSKQKCLSLVTKAHMNRGCCILFKRMCNAGSGKRPKFGRHSKSRPDYSRFFVDLSDVWWILEFYDPA